MHFDTFLVLMCIEWNLEKERVCGCFKNVEQLMYVHILGGKKVLFTGRVQIIDSMPPPKGLVSKN